MTKHTFPFGKKTRLALLVASSLAFSNLASAQVTSSAIRGQVLDTQGNPVSGVVVEVIHTPTGSRKTLTTSENGVFQSGGMTVGGPYEVKLQDGSSYEAQTISDLFLQLGRTSSVELQAAAGEAQLEVIEITGRVGMAGAFKKGPSNEYTDDDINKTAAISRDIKSLLSKDSKVMVDLTQAGAPVLSIAGGNIRGNSLTVDGVKQNDDFGLNKFGYPGRRSPISLDSIDQVSVNIAPFNVTYGDFQGGNINIVTKSGTNEFHGSAYYYTSDDDMIGEDSEGDDLGIGAFEEDTYGFTLGGRIIEDKLFFFTSYEKFESTAPYQWILDNGNGVADPNERSGVTQGEFDQISQIAQDVWDYDIGSFNVPKVEEAENLLVKLDWYINDDHRASLTYQDNEGNSVRDYWSDNFPNSQSASAESNRYNTTEAMETVSLQVYSDWTDDFSTEFKYSTKEVTTHQIPLFGANFAQMAITTPSGGTLYIGPDQFRHANDLGNERTNLKIKGDYYLTDEHKLTFGWEHEKLAIYNLFVFGSQGVFSYGSIDDFESRTTAFSFFINTADADPIKAAADFEYEQDLFYIQDEWNATDDLTVTYGLRYTQYSNDDKPVLNPNFVDRHNYSNQENFDGLSLVEPRVGLSYTYDDQTVIRGGIGVFGGGAPNVWLSNSYGNDGRRQFFVACGLFGFIPNDDGTCFNFDGRNKPQEILDFLAATGAAGGNDNTNSIHPDFNIPSVLKYNIGVERTQDLGVLGEDWLLTADVIVTDVRDAILYRELNISQQGTAPDGRPIYDTPTPFDLSLENTSEGGGQVWSASASKNSYTDYGTFSFDIGYTYQDITEINPGNSFIAFEGFGMPANSDYQAAIEYNSEFEVRHSITSNLSWSNEIFGDNTSTISIAYSGRSGRHFSNTMRTAGTFGYTTLGSWDDYSSQLLYIPTGVDDANVTFAAGFDTTGFFDYINSDSCLSDNAGTISRRHACTSDWIHRVNVRFLQEIQITDDQSIELTLDLENVGNLLNDDWGRVEGYNQPFNAPVVTATIVDDHYVYDNFTKPEPTVAKVASVWKVQLGIRYRF